MSAARKPQAKASPGPKPAADHGQDPAAAGARQQTTDTTGTKTAGSKRSNRSQTQQQTTPAESTTQDSKPTERVSLLLTPEDAKALKAARVEDGIDANKRLRAMVSLWRENERIRAQVDKRAKQYR